MQSLKKAFTLIEVQIASILMITVLIATGVIFYFALASMRYMHDAFTVYANATSAMKSLSDEVMVSSCYGATSDASGSIPQNGDSFWSPTGYIHGSLPDGSPPPGGYAALGLSGQNAHDALFFMPNYNAGAGNELYLLQPTQMSPGITAVSVAGDFPAHDVLRFYLSGNNELMVAHGGGNGQIVAENVTAFGFKPVSFNCLTAFLTVTGTVPSPLGGDVHVVHLTKIITLRCAPAVEPWLN